MNISKIKEGFTMQAKKHYLTGSRLLLVSLIIFLAGMGCASKAKKPIAEPPPHSHYYPFTEVIGEYHLRLIVDHHDGNMALVFEDYAERPVKPVKFKSMKGKVTFPDNTVKEQIFLSDTEICSRYCRRYYSRKYGFPRQKGVFSCEEEWIKTTPRFTLEVDMSFKGKEYHLTFHYEVAGSGIPYHRK